MTRDTWKRHLQERPDRPQGRQHRQLDVLLALADQLDAKTGDGARAGAGAGEGRGRERAHGQARDQLGDDIRLLRRTDRGHHRLGRHDRAIRLAAARRTRGHAKTRSWSRPTPRRITTCLPGCRGCRPTVRFTPGYTPGTAQPRRTAVPTAAGQAEQWSYDHEDPDEMVSPEGLPYSVDLARYKPLCCTCHWRFDGAHQRSATQGTQP